MIKHCMLLAIQSTIINSLEGKPVRIIVQNNVNMFTSIKSDMYITVY